MVYISIGVSAAVIYIAMLTGYRKAYMHRKLEIERSKVDVLHFEKERKGNQDFQLS